MAVVATAVRVKPKLRGVFHELGFYLALIVGPALVLTTDDARDRTVAAVFAGCVAACFGASALYHRPTWRPAARARLAHLDRAGVFMLIAGTYLPFGLLVMSPDWAVPMLAVVWGGALIAILLNLVWRRAPKLLSAARLQPDCPTGRDEQRPGHMLIIRWSLVRIQAGLSRK